MNSRVFWRNDRSMLACTRIDSFRYRLDGHRIIPICFDILLCPSHLPGFEISRVLMQQSAEIVRICEEKGHEHRLLQLRKRRKWQRIR